MLHVDVNADVGESFGAWSMGNDAALVPLVTSANIACGFHAGDPGVMRATVGLAREHGVAIGAHPGLPDLSGFGRREIQVTPSEVEDLVVYQIGALAGVAAAQGVELRHVKPHGALYNMAARDAALADAIARAVVSVDRTLVLFALSGSALIDAGVRAGLRTASEVFGDRAYAADGTLVSRRHPAAIVHDPKTVTSRLLQMVKAGTVEAIDGAQVSLRAETICVHGDTPRAVEMVRSLREALSEAGIALRAPRA